MLIGKYLQKCNFCETAPSDLQNHLIDDCWHCHKFQRQAATETSCKVTHLSGLPRLVNSLKATISNANIFDCLKKLWNGRALAKIVELDYFI